ncbi:hypothetical protein TKK_0015330 [Trichogramma kaykai]
MLELDLNTDGLSLSRSNPHTYWPIQYRVRNIPEFKPLIADAPARVLILNHICHNGTDPCSKCKVAGYKFENRVMVFPGINFEKRNDVDSEALNYEDHQKGPTPLLKLGISPTKAPFDIMHLVYLGLTVKHLEAWILCRNDVTEEQLLTAENCLKAYVKFGPNLYTLPFVSYNVHAVQHLADDARLCGNLESVSDFVYENNMPFFKKNIRNHLKPLQQFANRLREKQGIQHKQSIISSSNILKLSIEHKEGPVPLWLEAYSYKQFKNCERENIFLVNDEVIVAVKKFGTTKDVFENPVKSSSVGIFECKNLSNELHMVLMTDVVCKYYRLPIWKNFSKKHEESKTKSGTKVNSRGRALRKPKRLRTTTDEDEVQPRIAKKTKQLATDMHSFFMTNQNKSFPNSSDIIAKSNNKENDALFSKQITENDSDESSNLNQLSFIPPEGFPMKSMEEFDELKSNVEKCNSLINYLKLYGGENLETAAKNYIKESMTDELSSKFIWCKKRESDKNAFTLWNTHWATLIWGILNNTFRCTIEQFSQAMQYGLRLAKQRYTDNNARDSKKNKVDSEKGRGAKKTL